MELFKNQSEYLKLFLTLYPLPFTLYPSSNCPMPNAPCPITQFPMPTKTDRILSYLPGTFQVLPRAIVLYAVADAFGKELLQAENSLAEVMSAHWVDKADRGAEAIKDLQLLAALYGLAPRKDDDGNVLESVEEFRTHLKRYVRTFLEGTVTVQGILRVTAEALGLQIADDDRDLDSWWNRQQKELVTFEPRDDDATALILGVKEAIALGEAARPAQVKGSIKLSSGVNLQGANRLQLKIDSRSLVTIDLVEGVTDPTSVSLAHIKDQINASLNATVASDQDSYLTLKSPTKGATSLLEIQEISNDAAERILGISPRTYQGREATAAQVTGTVDLSSGVNLNEERYLRLLIDGSNLGEIDLTAGNTTPRTLDQIRDAINNALTINVASHNNHFLTLTSPTRGFGSSIVFQEPAAQNAKTKLFGDALSFYTGQDAQPARIIGKRELTLGVDLSSRAFIQLRIDTQATVNINCAGENPAKTQGFEIVTKINQAVGREVASYNGKFVTLTSPTLGANAQIILEIPATGDAAEDIFGITPRTVRGEAATTARIIGTPQLETLPETSEPGVDLRTEHRLQIAVDGKAPVEIDLRSPATNLRLVTLVELQNAINAVLPNVASNDGTRLFLTSPTIGNVSSIAIAPLENVRRRRYVTRATILNEAAQAVLGFVNRQSQGTPATKAIVIGERDLSRGVDLQQHRFLRISIDGQPPQEVDFATNPHIARPRAAMLKEIIVAINEKLGTQIASDNGKQLILTSTNKIELLPHNTEGDARDALIGNVSDASGSPPLPAIITGEIDLLAPVNLSDRQLIRLSVDGSRPLDIDISGSFPEQTFLNEIVDKINAVVHGLASATDSDRLQLTSPTAGEKSQLSLLPLRYLELIEYPPEKQPAIVNILKHGDRLSVVHQGKDAEFAKITITAPDGVVGPSLVNEAIGWQIRLFTVLSVGDRAELWRDEKLGVQVKIIASTGETRTLPGGEILVGLTGAQAWVPFAGTKNLSNDDSPILQLNNPFAPNLVLLRAANRPGIIGNQITVSVRSATIPAVNQPLGRLVGQIRTEDGIYHLLGENQQVIAQLQPGKDVDLASYVNSVVVLRGTQSEDEPLIVVEEIAHLFDVTLRFEPAVGQLIEEIYNSVTIGVSSSDEYSLVRKINISSSSQLIKVEQLDKATVLSIFYGKSEWVYLDCYGSRFDRANFNSSYFPDELCVERGVFNISRFVSQPPDLLKAVFTASDTLVDPGVEIVFDWVSHRSGAFIVNLPADLPDLFGGKFNEARFSQGKDEAEIYLQAVTEPATDAYSLVKLINQGNPNHETPILPSKLVAAREVAVVPLGWQPITIPFRKPQFLTLGRNVLPEIAAIDNPGKDGFARIYLAENGFNNLIELKAKVSGAWGNKIAVSVRKSGPAMYDISIIYNDSRFENARAVVLGGEELPALTDKILQPGAIGVLQAKAAGVKASVTRDRCGEV